MEKTYDVIIVGGRVAGASLAMRLGKQNLKVLLLERSTFPSWPSVPSSPLIHPGTMRLLDGLGLKEDDYAHPDAKITHFILDVQGTFQAVMPTELLELDRNHLYGIDRNKFDTVLWKRAAGTPNVTARDNFSMVDVIRDNDRRATGIVAQTGDHEKEEFSADLVIGADGRFSLTATKVGAKPFAELNDFPSASYHAEWEGVAGYSETIPQPLAVFQLADGRSVLCIPTDKHKYIIANYLRTSDTNFENGLEDHYVKLIQSVPRLNELLKNARRVTPVVGVRRIDNGYRQAYGNGWALVGDAFHYESPLDGQGFYNALLASEFLAEAIQQWKNGRPWEEAGKEYQQRFFDSSHDMLKQTVKRIQQELYTPPPPPFVLKTLMRWVLTDPAYQKQFMRYLSRAIDPNTFVFGPSPGPILRGFLRDVFRVRA